MKVSNSPKHRNYTSSEILKKTPGTCVFFHRFILLLRVTAILRPVPYKAPFWHRAAAGECQQAKARHQARLSVQL